jgi:hypothetical protein
MPIVDPNADWFPPECTGDNKIEIVIAIHIRGADVESAARHGVHIECSTRVGTEVDIYTIAIGAIHQALRLSHRAVCAAISVKVAQGSRPAKHGGGKRQIFRDSPRMGTVLVGLDTRRMQRYQDPQSPRCKKLHPQNRRSFLKGIYSLSISYVIAAPEVPVL